MMEKEGRGRGCKGYIVRLYVFLDFLGLTAAALA